MRYIFLTSVILLSTLSGDDNMLLSEGAKNVFKQEMKTTSSGVMDSLSKQVAGGASTGSNEGTRDVMIVEPKMVAQDWLDAFRTLSGKRISEITFVLHDNSNIANVIDMEAMPGGYLMLFTVKTVQGPKYQIVKTSDISTLVSK